ncbi:hypothetical protein SNOG_09851 [Parastagonospora nodorum SN15]|uniref:Alcohol dehydrogenase-like N-terminal domain-containing protein n=1 Tax=Phaeosphaeria nodorum (strain SN15 / ATCC MYA-4574 / FGSC 10173) TaxID=321614 RepID=Q0UEG3_PHANO|nr:hypothetical protein SNOG_09851 [Parastagonospora nodorum SN15]EAT83116.1 hypothetical protein SNOG_09851 [Parastagonospora nodorum SN15]
MATYPRICIIVSNTRSEIHFAIAEHSPSDIHFWKRGRIGSLVVEGDCILGHEAAGVVLECGEGVISLKPGDRVAVEPGVPCETCFLCMDGRYNLCEDVKFSGVYPDAGTIQRYKTHPARWCHILPSNVSYSEGALLEPLSVVMHGIKSAGLSLGRGAVICGAGPIGLIALAAARASGAHPLVITDLEPNRLAFAKTFVPTAITYQVDPNLDAQSNAKNIRALFEFDSIGEYGAPNTVLECTGVESSVITAAYTIDLKFINRYRDTWPAGLQCLAGGILDLKPLVSHTYPLEKAVDALHICSDLSNGSIKVQIVDERDDVL